MEITKDQILEVLKQVTDPRTGHNIIESKTLESIDIQQGKVFLLLNTRGVDAQILSSINFQCVSAIEDAFPKLIVEIRKNEVPRPISILPQVKNCIAIGSGKGGVGKSTVTANLACALAMQGYKVGLIDADLYGPSIPTMFGVEKMRPAIDDRSGKPMLVPIQKHGVYLMSIGFVINPEQAVILRGPRLSGIIKQFLQDTVWPPLDFLLFDLPPGTGDIQLTLVQTLPIQGAIIVSTPQKVSCIDALKAVNMFKMPSIDVPVLGVVENMSWFSPVDAMDKKYLIFGEGGVEALAKEEDLPFLGKIPLVMSAGISSDTGNPEVLTNESFRREYIEPIALKITHSFANS